MKPAAKRGPGLWVWRRRIQAEGADEWLLRLAAAGHPHAALTARPGGSRVLLEIHLAARRPLESLRGRFGGTVAFLPHQAWQRPAGARFRKTFAGALIVQDHESGAARTGGLPVLRIPAGMAFGTGAHATTAMCLRQLILALRRPRAAAAGPRVLDAGTGSGILALAAAALGARVEAFDFDPDCVRECRANARRNPAVPPVRWRRADVRTCRLAGPFDVVTANLYAGLLCEALPRLAEGIRPGGTLIVSGLLASQEPAVRGALRRSGLTVQTRLRRGKWVALVVRKR